MEGEKTLNYPACHRKKFCSINISVSKDPPPVFSAGLQCNSFKKKGKRGLDTETGDKTRKVC